MRQTERRWIRTELKSPWLYHENKEWIEKPAFDDMVAQCDEAIQKKRVLEEALERIAQPPDGYSSDVGLRAIARAALEQAAGNRSKPSTRRP